MVQKYQNEISPILYYGISTKNNEKDLKIPNLQPPNWKSPYWMTLYVGKSKCEFSNQLFPQCFSPCPVPTVTIHTIFYNTW